MSVPDNYDVIKVTSSDATIRVDIDWDYSDLSELYIWQQDDTSGVVYYYDQGQFTVVEKTDGTGDYIEVQNVTTGTATISTARQTPQTQTYDLLNSEPIDPVALINAIDKNAKKIQETFSTVGNPDRQVITSVNPFDVPDKVTRAGKLMSFDENGDVQFTTSDEALDTAIGYAEEWANNPEDQLVSSGAGGDQVDDYSALHHSAKASAQRALAETARTGAETAETDAQTAQANAEIAESNAQTAESNALASENKAQLWAEEAEDVEVETGQYSAFHWAQKAQANSATKSAIIKDVKSAGTAGGTNVVNLWTKRDLNTIASDPENIISSLVNNEFTLGSGKYLIRACSPFWSTNFCLIRLGRSVGASDQLSATQKSRNDIYRASLQLPFIFAYVEVATTEDFSIEYLTDSSIVDGLGIVGSANAEDETYTQVEIIKVG